MTTVLGIDIGGTSLKAAPVDVERGTLGGSRAALATPCPAGPGAVAAAVWDLAGRFDTSGVVGIGFPGVVRGGTTLTAANLDPGWIGEDAASLFSRRLDGRQVTVVNDADAAGLAEIRFGAGSGHRGVVVVVTLGTGIGSAVFVNGTLVPNSEYGHLVIGGVEAEHLASGRAKHTEGLTWRDWTTHLERFLRALERLVWPDLIVIGGGVSAELERFCSGLQTTTPIVAAALGNDAGIVGAALAAGEIS